ncbi:barstar family protein [Chryseobacterium sp. 09-1422]|uniref:Barstar family protein n=1 Tax=Chryseobacterium kimseyorum TaxID=2984028 RepID=A0ABT3HW76_9FLAO|nr:barstar family protein [Chryseobacterium kimseyorum]MCW3167960.1 barstar family protein [Chryseobacterium kimseyorum]
MNTIYIDFADLGDYEDFYTQLKEKLELPAHFGDNLDALSDVISGELKLPLHLEFVNMSVDQLEIFEDLLTTLEDVEDKVEDFSFAYYLEQYDDEEGEGEADEETEQ